MSTTNNKNLGHVTAYGYAKSKGYTGTEEDFAELMASYADVGQTAVDAALAAQTAKGKAEEAQGKAEDAQEAAETAQGKAEDAQDAAEDAQSDAEAYGAGTRGGEAVGSSDPAYHNNAKYYSEQARESAATFETDKTLAVADKAADAKATGDALAEKYDIQMPIIEQVNKVLFEDKKAIDAFNDLMNRERKDEN